MAEVNTLTTEMIVALDGESDVPPRVAAEENSVLVLYG
jgi:hypothetical protein